MYCDVLLLHQASNYDQILTYKIPAHWTGYQVGLMVSVPVRQDKRKGLILNLSEVKPDIPSIKEVLEKLYPKPVVTAQGIELARWLSYYYACSLNKAIALFVIPQIRQKAQKILKPGPNFAKRDLLLGPDEEAVLALVKEYPDGVSRAKLLQKLGVPGDQAIEFLLKSEYLCLDKIFLPRVQKKQQLLAKLTEECPAADVLAAKAPRQAEIIEYLQKKGPTTLKQLKSDLGNVDYSVSSLEQKGYLTMTAVEELRDPLSITLKSSRPAELNEEQKEAAEKIIGSIREGKQDKWLLYGVTGSGKTEVYLQAVEEALKCRKQVLYLVPEISLTPQISAVLLETFGEQVAVLHSSLSAGERFDEWERIREGQANVIVGPRSAAFAPFRDLGLIIVDEEHESTYKQSEPDPRYDARTVVIKLAEIFQAVVVMGSATPSLTRLLAVQRGEYKLLRLNQRVAQRSMPNMTIVDLKNQSERSQSSIFSQTLYTALEKVLADGEQAILFINRRGFNTYIFCHECGTSLSCPHCAITLTYHQAKNKLVCHYCNYTRVLPKQCPSCGSRFMRYIGSGTERVAQEATRLFPQAKVLRMDVDTTRQKGSHTRILKEFQEGKAQILVGTQMIAKGLDFPSVTLVGIINPDTLINMPDFQAVERAFQLLTQVAGRAGRGDIPGEVIIQTYNPENYLYPSLVRYDYDSFCEGEMANRSLLQYPPYTMLARVLVSGIREEGVRDRVENLAKMLKIEIERKQVDVEILGPSPAPISLIKNRYRYHLILKGSSQPILQELALYLREQLQAMSEEPRVIIDPEAQNLL
ncbi:MAG: primosomal protein N' [Peptococcia bacterium]